MIICICDADSRCISIYYVTMFLSYVVISVPFYLYGCFIYMNMLLAGAESLNLQDVDVSLSCFNLD